MIETKIIQRVNGNVLKCPVGEFRYLSIDKNTGISVQYMKYCLAKNCQKYFSD